MWLLAAATLLCPALVTVVTCQDKQTGNVANDDKIHQLLVVSSYKRLSKSLFYSDRI